MTPPEALTNISITTGEKDTPASFRLEDEMHHRFIKVFFPTNLPPNQPQFERMWVRVVTFDAQSGILDTDPISATYVTIGQKVWFVWSSDNQRYEFTKAS